MHQALYVATSLYQKRTTVLLFIMHGNTWLLEPTETFSLRHAAELHLIFKAGNIQIEYNVDAGM